MASFNYSTMQMTTKIVYYGLGLGGKTTNLQCIYNHTTPESRGEMVSLETEADRTLFFDLLPLEVAFVDHNIGRILDRLQELGIYNDSLIVLASDHGEEHWEHAGFEHGHTLYGELVRVPLILKLPESHREGGAMSSDAVADRVGIGSITSTVMDLCGIEGDDRPLTYPSLAPLWGGRPEELATRGRPC